MDMKVEPFGPRNEEEAEVFAEETFRVDVQQAIHKLMLAQNISRKDLAGRLRTMEAEVDELFGDDAKIDFRMLARIFHVLNAWCTLTWNIRGEVLGGRMSSL